MSNLANCAKGLIFAAKWTLVALAPGFPGRQLTRVRRCSCLNGTVDTAVHQASSALEALITPNGCAICLSRRTLAAQAGSPGRGGGQVTESLRRGPLFVHGHVLLAPSSPSPPGQMQ
jgi:hypothetical protein